MEETPNGATVVWSGERSWFRVEMPNGHSISADQPEPDGGNHGPRPTDLLLAAAASCSGISARSLLLKMRQPLLALSVSATGTRASEWPRAFEQINLAFAISVGKGSDRQLIDKAVDRAVRKYCPVSATIESGDGGTAIGYTITVTEDETNGGDE
jgi:putative redox protein